jgi:aspartate kinase
MKINKFGGASIKDAKSMENVAGIIGTLDQQNNIIVVSAIGKTTNLLESICDAYFKDAANKWELFTTLKQNHFAILADLFDNNSPFINSDIENIFLDLECLLEKEPIQTDYDFYYDQIIPYGEILASRILSHYFNFRNIKTHWIDSRNFIATDDNYREARIDWENTEKIIKNKLSTLAAKSLIVMQGFIGKSGTGATTTLGREGSDYTAAILAYCLDSKELTIWKDVAGVMNADPKKFNDAQKIDAMSYNEAIELAYYGATVIHPKTIQPLKAKGIPLNVKSFLDPSLAGTQVLESGNLIKVPCVIVKENQCLLTFKSKDFSFIAEDNLQKIFSVFAKDKSRMHVMQNSAISFTCCTDANKERLDKITKSLSNDFDIEIQSDVIIKSVYNYALNKEMAKNKKALMRQFNENVYHEVVKANEAVFLFE